MSSCRYTPPYSCMYSSPFQPTNSDPSRFSPYFIRRRGISTSGVYGHLPKQADTNKDTCRGRFERAGAEVGGDYRLLNYPSLSLWSFSCALSCGFVPLCLRSSLLVLLLGSLWPFRGAIQPEQEKTRKKSRNGFTGPPGAGEQKSPKRGVQN